MASRPQRKKPTYSVGSVDNALRLLQMLRDVGEIRGKEAASELGISPSTAHRLMSMLVFRGFAVQDDSRIYLPGPSIGIAPIYIEGTRELRAIAKPHLASLRDDLDETTYLMILAGTSIRFILTIESSYPSHAGDRHGFVLPAETSAGGRAILAGMDSDEVARLYNDRSDPGVMAPYERLQFELRLVQSRGYALSVEEVETGIVSVAVPLRGHERIAMASISMSGPASRLRKISSEESIKRLTDARDAIDRDIASFVRDQAASPTVSNMRLGATGKMR